MLNRWVEIFKCCMTLRGIMLNADLESTWRWLTSDNLIYLVKYRGLSCFPLTCMSSGVNIIQGKWWEVWRQSSSSFSGLARIWVMKASALAKASLRAFLVDLNSLRSSLRVILVRILASWAKVIRFWWSFCFDFQKRFSIVELFLLLHGLLCGLLGWLKGGFRRICRHFVVYLQVRLTRAGLCYKRRIRFCNKDDCFLLRVS